MISHDLHLVMAATDKVLCLNQHVCCSGHPDQVSTDPAFLEIFGKMPAESLVVYHHHHDHEHSIHGDVIHKHDCRHRGKPYADAGLKRAVCGIILGRCIRTFRVFCGVAKNVVFGDTMAHSAPLGITLGLLFSVDLTLAITGVGAGSQLADDVDEVTRPRVRHTAWHPRAQQSRLGADHAQFYARCACRHQWILFGDLLAVNNADVFWSLGASLFVLMVLVWLWSPLLMITINEDLAKVEGVPVERIKFALLLVLSVFIAVAIKIVGVLLITSMLIIPAASARRLAQTLSPWPIMLSCWGSVGVAGFVMSFYLDTPVGPSIVSCGFLSLF